jgi:hypothetical protein
MARTSAAIFIAKILESLNFKAKDPFAKSRIKSRNPAQQRRMEPR